MKPTDSVNNLINCLTKDEDARQELWVYYLSGNPVSAFASYLDKINKEFTADIELQEHLWSVCSNPPSERFQELLKRFSNVERSIICLLALGLTVSEVSRYKHISEVRIKQVVSIIRDNSCWEELYGVEETTDRR